MKKQLIIGLSLLICANIQAQEAGHYLYLNAGGGLHNLSYNLQNGSEKGAFGYSFNTGYGYFFNKHWGVQAGVGLQSLKPTATLNYMTGAPSTDTDGAAYEYRTYYNNWKEQQQLLFLDIPLGVQYRYKLNEKFQILAGAGLKISIPVKTTYKTTGGEIVTSGYYSQWNVELKNMPRHGFNTITDQLTGDVSLKPSTDCNTPKLRFRRP
jgi:OmpA-OmpF porin, OOP family